MCDAATAEMPCSWTVKENLPRSQSAKHTCMRGYLCLDQLLPCSGSAVVASLVAPRYYSPVAVERAKGYTWCLPSILYSTTFVILYKKMILLLFRIKSAQNQPKTRHGLKEREGCACGLDYV